MSKTAMRCDESKSYNNTACIFRTTIEKVVGGKDLGLRLRVRTGCSAAKIYS